MFYPLSQQEQEQREEPHQNIPEVNILDVLNLAKSLTKPNQTHASPLLTLTLLPPPDISPALPLQKKNSDPNFFSDLKLL